jgi:hypothetical protein
MDGWMNNRHRHLALPSFPQYADSLTGMLHINGYRLKSLLLETAVASSLASLPAYFENAKVFSNAMTAYVNATKPVLMRMTRRYTSEIGLIIGPDKDIPTPDVNTNEQTMAWMMVTYSMN